MKDNVHVELCSEFVGRRRDWVEIGVAAKQADALGDVALLEDGIEGDEILAIRSPRRLPGVNFYHAQLDHRSGRIAGVLKRDTRPTPATPRDFNPHPFVADSYVDLIPAVVVRSVLGYVWRIDAADLQLEVVEKGPSRMVIRHRGWCPDAPILFEGYTEIWANQPQVRFSWFLGFGGDAGEIGERALSLHVDSIELQCGEFLAIANATALGIGLGNKVGATWTFPISGPRDLGRGEMLPIRGQMLCLPHFEQQLGEQAFRELIIDGPAPALPPQWLQALEVDGPVLGAFQAILLGSGLRAGSSEWDGYFSTYGLVPLDPIGVDLTSLAEGLRDRFIDRSNTRGDFYDTRPLGLSKNAGVTGAQEDFSAAQDVVTLRLPDPLRIDELLYSLDGYWLRPFHNRGRHPLRREFRFADHASTRTWSQVPESRVGSRDAIGWPDVIPSSWPRSGYLRIDDQHRSAELLTLLAHMVDDYSLDVLLEDFLQTDLAGAKINTGALDAARADGRLLGHWADMLGLLKDEGSRQRLTVIGDRLIDARFERWDGAAIPQEGEYVRPLELTTDPSISGGQARVVATWQHSIAAMGYYAWWLRTQNPRALELVRRSAELVAKWGMFQDQDGEFVCAVAFRWLEGGVPLGPDSYRVGSPDLSTGGYEWWRWILPVLLIADHLNERKLWGEQPWMAKAIECAKAIYGNGPLDEQAAEWWACVPEPSWSRAATPMPMAVASQQPPATTPGSTAAIEAPQQ